MTPLTCLQSSFQLISSPPSKAGEINILHHPLAGNRLPWEFPFKPQTKLSHLNFAQLIVESSHQHPQEKEFTLKAQIILYLHVQHFLWLAEGPSAFFSFACIFWKIDVQLIQKFCVSFKEEWTSGLAFIAFIDFEGVEAGADQQVLNSKWSNQYLIKYRTTT